MYSPTFIVGEEKALYILPPRIYLDGMKWSGISTLQFGKLYSTRAGIAFGSLESVQGW